MLLAATLQLPINLVNKIFLLTATAISRIHITGDVLKLAYDRSTCLHNKNEATTKKKKKKQDRRNKITTTKTRTKKNITKQLPIYGCGIAVVCGLCCFKKKRRASQRMLAKSKTAHPKEMN